ncbi:MAG: ABC transporter substrate-binding protein [Lachnospiraceae bacterium]|nr:ABC transporter substrate-binding protein [Lachnospiraceae bacterium]
MINETANGNILIDIHDSGKCLIVKKGNKDDKGTGADIIIEEEPENIYLASSSVMDHFRELDVLSLVGMTSTKADDWSIPEAGELVDMGKITYVGKYSLPDYELLLNKGCSLAIENTMIYHNPEVKETLESFGIPVIVERSSYESDPLGRLEWIKVYGAITGKYEEACDYFERCVNEIEKIASDAGEIKKTAFFSIGQNGIVSIRTKDDYMTEMIRIAGGSYPFESLSKEAGTNKTLVTIQMESFYEQCRDADILIYNSTIQGDIRDLKDLYEKSEILAGIKACKEGNVFCMEKDMFQQPTDIKGVILDLAKIIRDPAAKDDELKYLHRLE